MPLLFGFFESPYDWLVIALLAFLFFGNRLPTVMRSLGEGVTEFKKGMGRRWRRRSMTILRLEPKGVIVRLLGEDWFGCPRI